jgi:hypothetical protein
MNKSDYYFYKGLGICVKCHRYSAVPGKTKCEKCSAKVAEQRSSKRDSMSREEKTAINAKQYQAKKKLEDRRRDMGVCLKCGRMLSRYSIRFCPEHLVKERNRKRCYAQKKRGHSFTRAELPLYGICYRCCKNPVIEGKKMCAVCYGKNLHTLEIARHSKNAEEGRAAFKKMNIADFMKACNE